jgi:hypothetical protein
MAMGAGKLNHRYQESQVVEPSRVFPTKTRRLIPRTPVATRRRLQHFKIYSDSSKLGGFMAKGKSKHSAVDRAAEAVGHALGSVAGTIDSLEAQHPHPVEEAREALAAGQETLFAAASKAGAGAAAMVKKAKAVTSRTKKVVTRARLKSTPAIARVTRTARKMVKRARKAVSHGRKTVRRAAGRLKR